MVLGIRLPSALFAAAGAAACIGLSAGCGGDADDEGAERVVTETVSETGSTPVETETGTVPDQTITGPSDPAIPEAEAEADITDTLRAFNRTANAGKLQQACQGFFSEAFLTRLPTERKCATTLAGARAGRTGKMVIFGVYLEGDETAVAAVVMGGIRNLPEAGRNLDLVFENGAWKIDAVNTYP